MALILINFSHSPNCVKHYPSRITPYSGHQQPHLFPSWVGIGIALDKVNRKRGQTLFLGDYQASTNERVIWLLSDQTQALESPHRLTLF